MLNTADQTVVSHCMQVFQRQRSAGVETSEQPITQVIVCVSVTRHQHKSLFAHWVT